jgi:GT2 family glycosyltransferase
MMKLSAYLPFYNNQDSVLAALYSLDQQQVRLDELFAIDDGSTDGGADLVEANGFRCLRQPANLGRGAARHRAMLEATAELVVCCDATNILPPDFVRRLLPWFDDPKVAAVYGRIQDPEPRGAVGRWRARHLFKQEHPMQVRHHAPLITYGTLVRRSAVLEVGNYDPALRHSEDAELGERLLVAGYDVIFDPSVPVICNVQNSLGQVLERYWRWYAGKDERISWRGYWRNVVYSIKGMAWQDLKAGDPAAALISLLCPHYQFWK